MTLTIAKIKSGKGDDLNFDDKGDRNFAACETDGNGVDDKINAGQGNDQMTGGGGADKFQCGSGSDTITDFDESEGDKASGNCEGVEKGNWKANGKNR
jgi:Ca2+-binding RTX toxin-like protein